MEWLKAVLLGVGKDPKVVATARALALYLIPLGSLWLIGYLNGLGPAYYGLTTLASPFIRAVAEGLIDQLKKGTQNDPHPNDPAGVSDGEQL